MQPVVKAYRGSNPAMRMENSVELLNTDANPQRLMWMTPATARSLAKALSEAADWVEERTDNERTFNVEVSH